MPTVQVRSATGSVVGADRASAGVAIGSNTSVTLGVDSSPSRILVNGNLSIANGNGNPIVAPNGIIATGNISVAAGNSKITGTVCGVRIEEIDDPLMRKIRYLDKLVDELAKGRPMEKILRQ